MEAGLDGLGRRSVLALGGAGVSGLATIGTIVIASRSLTTRGAGEFFVAISLFAIVQGVCSFGAETGFQFFVPTMSADGGRRLVRIVASASLGAGLAIALIVWLLAQPIGELLAESGEPNGRTASVIRTIAVLLPFAGLYEVTMGALRARDRVLFGVVLDRIVRPLLQIVATIVAVTVSDGSRTVVVAWAVPIGLAVVVATGVLITARPTNVSETPEDVSQATFWRYTAPRSVARIAQTITQRIDVLILAAVYPLEEAAIYGTVSRCMIAGVFVATALRQTIQSRLRRLVLQGDRVAVKNMYGVSTTWLVLVTWPVYLLMITHAPLIMSAFGPEYVRGAPALVLLCSAMLVASASGLVDVVLLMLGRSWLSTINVTVALILNVTLNLLLAPEFGMIGSAIAWVVAILASNVFPLIQTAHVAGLHPGGVPLATAIAAAVLAFALPMAIGRVAFGVGIGPFAVVLVIALIVYGATLHKQRGRLKLDQFVQDLRRRVPAPSHG